jgi:citrate synthase
MDVYLSASEAAAFLGVAKPSLYAYVSRGLVRSQPGADSRVRTYNRLDLEQLQARKRIRNRPQAEVAVALHRGAPLLDSALTLITKDGLYYRGSSALELALNRSFWEVARWFWSGHWEVPHSAPGRSRVQRPRCNSDPFHLQQSWLIERSHTDSLGYQWAMPFAGETGTAIVRQFLAFLTGTPSPSIDHAASELAACWCRRPERAERILNAVLILALDHEINVSSFTARVVASAGSNLYEVVNAAMSAFSGSRHGRTSERAEQFIGELEDAGSAGTLIHARLRAGEEIPGFGHPLYPDGDPRAKLILRLMAEDFPAEFAKIRRKIIDSEGALRQSVNLDLAVAAVGKVLGLPVHSGFHLFALGRTAGWIAHAVEQNQSGEFIRPRARYTGVMPVISIRGETTERVKEATEGRTREGKWVG